ncbi:MFS transporter [Caproiciproducens sp. CPB-2]|uniref:MFS transporter n=1 Tax=Caproiciproducens sp. CPB-2 TaxID=3030017 RepID=UPI0023DA67F9|nr:MFS transporter [Caproiciproducens sp. CPB-2]MDF1494703.1 MFS transporter [Caproiciproducens sp. CPB-2]
MNKRNVYLLYGVALLQGMVFYAPIATLYRQARGLGIFEITLIESISMVVSLALELPWGFLAERIGYRRTLLICNFFYFVSKIVFWQAAGFGMFLLERLILAVVISGLSGCDSAFLYLSAGKADSLRVFGIYSAMGSAGTLLASTVFSLFLHGNSSLSALFTVFSYGFSLLLTIFSTEVENHVENSKNFRKQVFGMFVTLKNQKTFLWFLLAAALFAECSQTITVFLNQLQYQRGGIRPETMGLLYLPVIVAGLFAARSHRLVGRMGEGKACALLFLTGGVACLAMFFSGNPVLSVGCVVLLRTAASLFVPIQMEAENRTVSAGNRAAVLSAYSVAMDVVSAGTNLLFGKAAQAGVAASMLLGAGFCLAALLSYGIWRRAGTR